MNRRTLLQSTGLTMSPAFALANSKPRIAVIGAGAFGGWTALSLLRKGAIVTLVDAWGPGNSRASSGGETRVIRATYGSKRQYVQMAVRLSIFGRKTKSAGISAYSIALAFS
jgi:glycine/D-amino acid oxidase-like deaminating enzyme